MSSDHAPEPKNFAPKEPVNLDPPKDDPITVDELAKCDGTSSSHPTYVAIKSRIYDVTGNKMYAPGGAYHSKDASRALAKSSLLPEDVRAEWEDLEEKEKGVLGDWETFFGKRYNIVGRVVGGERGKM
ncbi:MAG: hypothetical protein M1817_006854 [Caeruleum heppii]|nr:MAG: hypothetical protein M1817_006854 [Caeruleum heppii]